MTETISNENPLKGLVLIFFIIGIIVGSIVILISTIYLFKSPGVLSGLSFATSIIVFVIAPLIYGIYYLFKERKKEKQEPKIITITQLEND